MVRVMFYTGVAMLAVSAALLYLPTYFSYILAGVFALSLILCVIFRQKIKIPNIKIFFSILLVFSLFGIYTLHFSVAPAATLENHTAEITGTVAERPEDLESHVAYVIDTEKITIIPKEGEKAPQNIPQKVKVRLTDVSYMNLKVFEKVKLNVTFNSINDFRNSNLSKGIYACGYSNTLIERLGFNRPFYAVFYDLSDRIDRLIYSNIHYDEAAVLSAILLGNKNNLSNDFVEDSKATGVTHVLVVSGGHLGIIFQLLGFALGLLKINRKFQNWILLFSVFALEAICCFSSSILRAGLTYVILVVGMMIHRKADSLNSLGAATVIILFTSPFGIADLGLMLSLAATFGLIFLCPIIYNETINLISRFLRPNAPVKWLVLTISQTVSAIIATTPVCIMGIGYISVIAPIANLFITSAVNVITTLSFITVILLFLPSFLKVIATIPIIILCLLVRYIVFVTDYFADIEWAITVAHPQYIISLLSAALIIPVIFLLSKLDQHKKAKLALKITSAILAVISVLSAALIYAFAPTDKIAVLNVGDGTAVAIMEGDTSILVGAGDGITDQSKIENYMFSKAHKNIDYIVLPTCNKSFAGGAPELIYRQPFSKVIHPDFGDNHSKLEHIATDQFKTFNSKISFNTNNIEVITLADIGTVVNLRTKSVIIYTGQGDATTLFKLCKNSLPTFIASDGVPDILPKSVGRYIICGSDENKSAMQKVLNKSKTVYTVTNSKHIEIPI